MVLTGGQGDPKGGTVVSGERGGAEAERAERHAGDGGEGEDGEEREGAGGQESQASVERDRHGEQRVGEEPEAERHPAEKTRRTVSWLRSASLPLCPYPRTKAGAGRAKAQRNRPGEQPTPSLCWVSLGSDGLCGPQEEVFPLPAL